MILHYNTKITFTKIQITNIACNTYTSYAGFKKILESSLPLGQVALKFCLPMASLSLPL